MIIAVIAILAAMLLPALQRARPRADSVVCKSNLRQLGIAVGSYTGDFAAYPSGNLNGPWWPEALRPYTGSIWPEQNFSDPSDGTPKIPTKWVASMLACPGYNRMPGFYVSQASHALYGAYGYNAMGVASEVQGPTPVLGLAGWYYPDTTAATLVRLVRETDVVFPSDMIAFQDANLRPDPFSFARHHLKAVVGLTWLVCVDEDAFWADSLSAGVAAHGGYGSVSDYGPMIAFNKLFQKRHLGRWNTVFCDGHVENLRARNLFARRWQPGTPAANEVLKRWNSDNRGHADLVAR